MFGNRISPLAARLAWFVSGIRPHSSHWVFGFSYQVVAQALSPEWYLLTGVIVTNASFELCNNTRTALNTQAHSSSCTPIPVYES